jgi:uncharacterized protein YfiM (DUF2279 family)
MFSAQWVARDAWFGLDKLDHFAWSISYWLVLTGFGAQGWTRFWLFTIGAIGVEVVQLIRFRIWVSKSRPMPYPAFADGISYRDLVYDYAGMVAAMWLLARIAAQAAV